MTMIPTSIQLEQTSNTAPNVSSVTFPGVVLAVGLALATSGHAAALNRAISPIERSGTVGQFGNAFSRSHKAEPVDFEGAITQFYSTLLSNQELLGREFEHVLQDNLWDLYARS